MHFLLFLLLIPGVFAQELSTVNENVTKIISEENLAEKLRPDRVTYFTIFTGPSFGNFNDPVNEEGEIQNNDVNTWMQISLQYKMDNGYHFVVNPRFVMNHNPAEDEKTLTYDSPVFGIIGTWYENGNLSFGGGLNTILPAFRTRGAREDGLLINPGGFQSLSYKVSDTFSIGSWLWARAYLYNKSTNETGEERAEFFLAPRVTKIFSDKISATAFYQINGDLKNTWETRIPDNESLNLMFSYSVSEKLNIEPMITLFRESSFKVSEANLNVWLSGRFF